MWIFQLDDNRVKSSPALQCLDWYETQAPEDSDLIEDLDSLLSPCPCSFREALFDPRFRFAWWEGGFYENNYCFYTMLSPQGKTGARVSTFTCFFPSPVLTYIRIVQIMFGNMEFLSSHSLERRCNIVYYVWKFDPLAK